MSTELGRELVTAVEDVRAAGDILRKEFNRPQGARGAHGHAEADEAAERMILQIVGSAFFEDGILGEEIGTSRASLRNRLHRLWVVDPNDGRSAYLQRFRGAAVSR